MSKTSRFHKSTQLILRLSEGSTECVAYPGKCHFKSPALDCRKLLSGDVTITADTCTLQLKWLEGALAQRPEQPKLYFLHYDAYECCYRGKKLVNPRRKLPQKSLCWQDTAPADFHPLQLPERTITVLTSAAQETEWKTTWTSSALENVKRSTCMASWLKLHYS